MLAQEAALPEHAKRKLRRPLADNKSSDRTDVAAGGPVILFMLVGRKSDPKSRGPATEVGIDATSVNTKSQGRTSKVARSCVRKLVGPKGAGDAEG